MNDCDVITAFITQLRESHYPNLYIDRWPDKDNRDSPDIDAIAGNFAIEHTSVDTVPDQRRNDDWFMQAVNGLEEELSPKLNYRLSIEFPYEGIQRGQKWSMLRECLKTWVVHSSPDLTDGVYVLNGEIGLPFEVRVVKRCSRRPGLYFLRGKPDDDTLENRCQTQFTRKAKKLRPYKNKGYTTILLVESEDIALMSPDIMLEAIRQGFSRYIPDGVDQVWYADTAIAGECSFYDFTKSLVKMDIYHQEGGKSI